jgi:hypothetical protein
MSIFDPQTFAQMTFTESNSTESTPVPVGEWPFTVTKSEITAWTKRDDPSKGGLKCTLIAETDDPAVAGVTGRPKNVLRYEMMLDLTPEGGLDFGKGMNVALGRAREAMGLNKPGAPFAFDMFVARPFKGTVKHEVYQDKLQARITAVAAA